MRRGAWGEEEEKGGGGEGGKGGDLQGEGGGGRESWEHMLEFILFIIRRKSEKRQHWTVTPTSFSLKSLWLNMVIKSQYVDNKANEILK